MVKPSTTGDTPAPHANAETNSEVPRAFNSNMLTEIEEITDNGQTQDQSIDNETHDQKKAVTKAEKPTNDIIIVDQDGPHDPENPVNFNMSIKIINVEIISFLTFISPLESSMFAPEMP